MDAEISRSRPPQCVEALGHPCYVQDPTMGELQAHTAAGVRFALEHHNDATAAGSVVIGAWNENDEGEAIPSRMGWDRMGRGGMSWDGMGWDGMGWDGMRCDAMRWDGMRWDGLGLA